MEINQHLYRSMVRIRRFEETVLAEFSHGAFYGTTHTSLGQEADAVGVLDSLQAGDVVFSNHRCHGHFLAYGGDMRALFAELMGKASGVCGGRGGSQHLHWRNFYSNGILGGTLPIATGAALAEKRLGSGVATVVFLGDGALGEGVVYESLNFASLWGAPVLFVLEDNHWAQTTPISWPGRETCAPVSPPSAFPCASWTALTCWKFLPWRASCSRKCAAQGRRAPWCCTRSASGRTPRATTRARPSCWRSCAPPATR